MMPELVNGLFALAGAVVGAILSGAIAFAVHHRTKVRKELSVRLSRPIKLVDVHDSVRDAVKITVRGHPAETVSTMDYYIANTGNSVVENINIQIHIKGGTEIFGGTAPQTNIEGASIGDVKVFWEDRGSMRLEASFLNPGDEIRGHLRLANLPTQTDIEYRAPGVKLLVIQDYDQDHAKVYSNLILELAKRNFILDLYLKLASPAYRKHRKRDKS